MGAATSSRWLGKSTPFCFAYMPQQSRKLFRVSTPPAGDSAIIAIVTVATPSIGISTAVPVLHSSATVVAVVMATTLLHTRGNTLGFKLPDANVDVASELLLTCGLLAHAERNRRRRTAPICRPFGAGGA
jgi:hypothetical protein